jgi:hypothetical protein
MEKQMKTIRIFSLLIFTFLALGLLALPSNSEAALTDSNCMTCHENAVDDPATTGTNESLAFHHALGISNCQFCHVAPSPTCTTCHGTQFSHENVGTVDGAGNVISDGDGHQVDEVAGCASCHTDLNNMYSGIETTHAPLSGALPCYTCHLSTRSDVTTTINDGVLAGPADTGANCASCHDPHNFGNIHNITVTGGCASCHDALNTTDPKVGIEAVHDTPRNGEGSCATCHSSSDATTIGYINDGIPNALECSDCHNAHVFNDIHSISETPGCAACHPPLDGTSNLTFIETIHATPTNGDGSCATCHNSTDSKIQGFIDNKTAVQCSDCHDPHNFANLHDIVQDAGCNACHTELDAGPKAGIESVHDLPINGPDSCSTCHNSGRAVVQAAISTGFTPASPGSCASCHTPPHGTTPGDVAGVHNFFADSTDCSSCHVSGTAEQRINLHADCSTCHDSTKSDVMDAISDGRGGTTVTCGNCHTGPTNGAIVHGTTPATAASSHDFFDDSATCTACHMTETAEKRLDIHPDCTTCHSDTADQTVKDTIDFGRLDNSVSCEDCHNDPDVTMHALDATGAASFHENLAVPATSCADCHETADDSEEARINLHPLCTTCHATPKTTVKAAITAGIGTDTTPGTPQSCEVCHTGPPAGTDNQGATDHGVEAGTAASSHNDFIDSADCTACHMTSSPVIRLSIHMDCTTCHSSTVTAVSNTIEAGIAETDVSCRNCHDDPNVSLHGLDSTGAQGIHENLGGSSGNTCNDCHMIADAKQRIDVHPDCTTCHTSGKLDVTTAIANGKGDTGTMQNCETCHTGGNNGATDHGTTNADAAESHDFFNDSATCTACHMTDTAEKRLDAHPDCLTCHGSSADQTVKDTITAGRGDSPVSCENCHNDPDVTMHGLDAATAAGIHENLAVPATNCADCHETGTAVSAEPRISLHPLCTTCHASMKTTVKATIAAGIGTAGTPQSCEICHNGPPEGPDVNAAMEHGFDAAGAASSHDYFAASSNCTACHVSGTAAERLLVHPVSATDPASDCATCHESTNAMVMATINNGRGDLTVSCENCHRSDNTIKYHGLDNAGAAPVHNNFEAATDCGQCHDIDTAEKRLAVHKQGCNTCHADAASIAVIDTARGDSTTKVNCKSCHGEYDHPNATHLKTDLNTQPCWNCHGQGSIPLVTLHGEDCLKCHTSPRDQVKQAIASGMGGASLTCNDCHSNAVDPDTHHYPAHDNTFTQEVVCQDCHDQNVAMEHHYKRGTLCGSCHADPLFNSTTPGDEGVITKGRSSWPTPEPVYCNSCHIATDMQTHRDGHDKTVLPETSCDKCHTPNVAVEHVDRRNLACTVCHASNEQRVQDAIAYGSGHLGGTVNCSDCHDGPFDHKSVHDMASPPYSATPPNTCATSQCHDNNVVVVHVEKRGRDCSLCHEDPLFTTPGGIIDRGIAGEPIYCTECHITADHSASHNDTNVPEPVCENCHDPNVFVEHVTVRNRDCDICHNATYQAVIDDGASKTSPPDPPVTCTNCHGPTPNHHDNDTARTGMCATCHIDPRPLENDPQQLACRECHVDNNGFIMTSAPAPSHAWNTDPLDNSIKDFGACFACHAPIPFHAKPAQPPLCWDTNPQSPSYIPGLTPGRGTFNLFYEELRTPERFYRDTPDEERARDYCRSYRNDFDQPEIVFYWFPIVYQGEMMDVPAFDQAQPFPPYPHSRINAVGNCGECHIVGTVVEVTHNNDCIGCHFSPVKKVKDTIAWGRAGNVVDCFNCHSDQGHDAQHDKTVLTQPSCGDDAVNCHVANVATEHVDKRQLACATCHESQDQNVIDAINKGKNGFTVDCLECHGSADHTTLHAATVTDEPGCMECHAPNVVTEHVVNQGLDCVDCHDNPNPNVPGDVAGVIAGTAGSTPIQCSDCHGPTDHPSDHDNAGPAPGSNCTDCHHEANVVDEHVVRLGRECSICHDDPQYSQLITNGSRDIDPVYVRCEDCHVDNAGDHAAAHNMAGVPSPGCTQCHKSNVVEEHVYDRQLSCGTCHDNSTYTPWIDLGKSGTFVTCYNCHGENSHHNTTQAQTGDCTYCHADPRLNEPQAEVIPSGQLACRECHGSYQHGNGGPIQDYSACFACHQPVPYHAAPTQNFECWDTNPSYPGYIPGLTPGRGTFNLFWSAFHLPDKYYDDTPEEEMGKDYCRRYRNDFDEPAINYNAITFYDFFNTKMEWTVPTFEAGDGSTLPTSPPGGVDPPGGGDDTVTITYARYDSSRDRLTVYAESSMGDNVSLTVHYDNDTYSMNWDSSDNRFEERISDSRCRDSTIEVTSSGGGSDTSSVENCSSGGWGL